MKEPTSVAWAEKWWEYPVSDRADSWVTGDEAQVRTRASIISQSGVRRSFTYLNDRPVIPRPAESRGSGPSECIVTILRARACACTCVGERARHKGCRPPAVICWGINGPHTYYRCGGLMVPTGTEDPQARERIRSPRECYRRNWWPEVDEPDVNSKYRRYVLYM